MGKAETAPVGYAGTWTALRRKTASASPAGTQSWPREVKGELGWGPNSSFPSREEFVVALTADDVSEIRDALRHFNGAHTRHVRLPHRDVSPLRRRGKTSVYTGVRCRRPHFPCPRSARG